MSEPNREGAEGAGQPSDDDDFAAALEACMASDEDDEMEEGEDLLTTLPDDCLLRILRFLPHASLLTTALRSVNKRFGDAVAAEGVSRTRDRLKQSLEAGFAADIRRSEGGGGGSSSSSAAGSGGGGGSSSDVDMTPPPPPPAPPHGRLDELASALELALRTCGGATFRLKFRPLVFNLGDPKKFRTARSSSSSFFLLDLVIGWAPVLPPVWWCGGPRVGRGEAVACLTTKKWEQVFTKTCQFFTRLHYILVERRISGIIHVWEYGGTTLLN